MFKLDQASYSFLKQDNLNANDILRDSSIRNWYEISYELFKKSTINNIEDLWRIVAYTYSWMPTIPNIKAHLIKDQNALIKNLKSFKKGDSTKLPSLLSDLFL